MWGVAGGSAVWQLAGGKEWTWRVPQHISTQHNHSAMHDESLSCCCTSQHVLPHLLCSCYPSHNGSHWVYQHYRITHTHAPVKSYCGVVSHCLGAKLILTTVSGVAGVCLHALHALSTCSPVLTHSMMVPNEMASKALMSFFTGMSCGLSVIVGAQKHWLLGAKSSKTPGGSQQAGFLC